MYGQVTGYPGGYCTASCSPSQPCATGVCVSESILGVGQSTCRAECPSPGAGQSTCRAGYVCAHRPGTTTPSAGGFCRPSCVNGGLATCSAGTTCNGSTGYCQ